MKVICAPDSFKETLSASDAASAMARGVMLADADAIADLCPVGDGGEGTLEALIAAMHGQVHEAQVTGPLGQPITARFGIVGVGESRLAIVELAQASGLALLPMQERNPMRTTTFGTGELIRIATQRGCTFIIVCIGGSATVDGGTGIAQALGARFYDARGDLVDEPITGGMLAGISRWSPPADLPRIEIACDVINPLCGPDGAAAMYGPQKGATPQQVRELDAGLAHLASIVGVDATFPGAGAAGGAGYGLVAMCGGMMRRGIDLVLDAVRFDQRCAQAQLVLTGEGRLDAQSLHGKATMGVARRAATHGVPTVAIVGSTGEGAAACVDVAGGGMLREYISLAERFGLERAMREPMPLIQRVAAEVVMRMRTA